MSRSRMLLLGLLSWLVVPLLVSVNSVGQAEELGASGTDMLKMYEWFVTEGFSVDIENLRANYPEIGWTPFAEWTKSIDWESVLAP